MSILLAVLSLSLFLPFAFVFVIIMLLLWEVAWLLCRTWTMVTSPSSPKTRCILFLFFPREVNTNILVPLIGPLVQGWCSWKMVLIMQPFKEPLTLNWSSVGGCMPFQLKHPHIKVISNPLLLSPFPSLFNALCYDAPLPVPTPDKAM